MAHDELRPATGIPRKIDDCGVVEHPCLVSSLPRGWRLRRRRHHVM